MRGQIISGKCDIQEGFLLYSGTSCLQTNTSFSFLDARLRINFWYTVIIPKSHYDQNHT